VDYIVFHDLSVPVWTISRIVHKTEQAGTSGYKHEGTLLVIGLVLARELKAARDNRIGIVQNRHFSLPKH
jgi:predicted GNAT family acetyltransferase